MASETGWVEPLSTREAVATDVPARRLMSASDAIALRVCQAATRVASVWQTLSARAIEEREEAMQELEQRAAWDGKIFVDGGFRGPEGGATLTVLDKAAQAPIGSVGVASPADLDAAVGAARAAQPAWAAEPYDVRAGILRAAAAALEARADEVASLIVRETGSSAARPTTRSAARPTSSSRPRA